MKKMLHKPSGIICEVSEPYISKDEPWRGQLRDVIGLLPIHGALVYGADVFEEL